MSEPDDVADGQDHSLDPRAIPMQRVTGGLTTAAIALGSLVALAVVMLVADNLAGWQRVLMGLAWLVLAVLGATFVDRWPVRSYDHTSYRIDDLGIEIRRGVYWRVVINLPRSRVQHIDVSQGPIDRRYGLGTLVLYTAGTDHAKVALGGLEHGRALRIREHLLPPGADDAV